MDDYRRVFGEEVALGLGLVRPPLVRETIADYEADPAGAFTRMAERLQPPGGALPVPFSGIVTDSKK